MRLLKTVLGKVRKPLVNTFLIELITYLSDIEWTSEILSDKIKRLSDFAYEHVNDQDESVKIKFGYLLWDVIDSEQRLLELYAGFLEKNII